MTEALGHTCAACQYVYQRPLRRLDVHLVRGGSVPLALCGRCAGRLHWALSVLSRLGLGVADIELEWEYHNEEGG